MCDYCIGRSTEMILDTVILGFSLEASIRIVRDIAVQQGLNDRGLLKVEDIEDVQHVSDQVTAAGDELRGIRENIPAVFSLIVENRRYQNEYGT